MAGEGKKSKRETTSSNFVGLLSVMVCHFFLKMTLQRVEFLEKVKFFRANLGDIQKFSAFWSITIYVSSCL